ncbi:unnamed protein product, partial [Staurois parvus]
MYVKWFDTFLVNVTFKIFEIPAGSIPCTSRRLQGTEPRRRMLASARGDGQGRCRGD